MSELIFLALCRVCFSLVSDKTVVKTEGLQLWAGCWSFSLVLFRQSSTATRRGQSSCSTASALRRTSGSTVRPFSWASPCSGEGRGSPEGDTRVDTESFTLFVLEMFPSEAVHGLQDTLCWNILAAEEHPAPFRGMGLVSLSEEGRRWSCQADCSVPPEHSLRQPRFPSV